MAEIKSRYPPKAASEGDTWTNVTGEQFVWQDGRWMPAAGIVSGTSLTTPPQVAKPTPEKKAKAPSRAGEPLQPIDPLAVNAIAEQLVKSSGGVLDMDTAMAIASDTVTQQWVKGRAPIVLEEMKKAGMDFGLLKMNPETGEMDDISDLEAVERLLATQMAAKAGQPSPEGGVKCALCGGDHATEDCPLAGLSGVDGGGGAGAAGMTSEEKQLAVAGLMLQLLSEQGGRERASIQELGDIADQWVEMLGRAVTPELKEMIASRSFTKPEEMKTERVSLAGIKQRAEDLPDMEGQLPQLQQILGQLLPGFQGGGQVGQMGFSEEAARQLLRTQPTRGGATYGSSAATDLYGLTPYSADRLVGQDWYIDEMGNAQVNRPQWQRETERVYGYGIPGDVGRPAEEWGPALQQAIAGGTATPTLGREQQEFDQEMTRIQQAAQEDIAEMEAASREEVARIYSEANVKAAQLQAAGMQAQAEATIAAAEASAQATIDSANIAAQNRLQVAAMQEQGAKERLGAQLGMQWAETSQQMAANPRDFLQLAFRQAGYGVPEALQGFLQPGGGTQPNMAGAPLSIQQILAEYLG